MSEEKEIKDNGNKRQRLICAGAIKLICEVLIYHIQHDRKINFFDNEGLKKAIALQLEIALKEPEDGDND